MSIPMRYVATLLAAGALAGVLSAPTAAAAANSRACSQPSAYVTRCSTDGSVSLIVRPNPNLGGPSAAWPFLWNMNHHSAIHQ